MQGGGGSDALGALRWGLRRYAWLFALCVIAVAVGIPAVALVRPATNDAESLIIAQRLDMSLDALPRYAEALFNDGEIARRVAAQFGDTTDIADVVPDRVSMVTEQDSIILQVVGHDPDAGTAAAIANLAAQIFVEALNAPGEGVGAFAIQNPAVPPTRPVANIAGPAATLPVGLAAGVLLGFAAVSVVLVLRRPVLEAADAERATGVSVLGTLTLPHGGEEFPPATEVVGIVSVGRRLLALGVPRVQVVAAGRAETIRRQVTVTLAAALSHAAKVRFVASPDLRVAAGLPTSDDNTVEATVALRINGGGGGTGRTITIVDVADPLDTGPPFAGTITVLLVERGMPLAALQSAVAEHLGGGPARLVLLRHGARGRPGRDQSPTSSLGRSTDRTMSSDRTQPVRRA